MGCLANFYPRRCGGLNPMTMFQDYRRDPAACLAAKRSRGADGVGICSRTLFTQRARAGFGALRGPSDCRSRIAASHGRHR